MGKVAIDFKINNTHNNTGQLLIFIYLFITSYPSLFMAAFPIRRFVCSALLCKRSFSFSQITNLPRIFTILYFPLCFFFCAYFAGVISETDLPWRKSAPEHCEATCALRPVQLRLGSRCWLLPACTQWSVRQRNRGDGGINDYLWSATSHPPGYPQALFITAAGCHCVWQDVHTNRRTHKF